MAIVPIQDAGNNGVSLSSLDVTLNAGTGVGNLLVACIGTLTSTVSSISGGGTWVRADGHTTGGQNAEIWYAPNVSGGVVTITVTLSGSDAVAADVSEYSGVAVSSALGGHNQTSGTIANPTSGSATPSSNGDLFVACAMYLPTTSTVSSQTAGWTALTSENASTSLALVDSYQIITDGSAKSDTWTLTPAVASNYVGVIATFLPTTTVLKFFLHRSSAVLAGTLPAAGASVSASVPTLVAAGGDTNRLMDGTKSAVAQTSNALTTGANVNPQSGLILRACSAPLEAQTIANQVTTYAWGGSESSTNSNFRSNLVFVVWRPSTGAVVGRMVDLDTTAVFHSNTPAGTTEINMQNTTATSPTTAVTALAGDILVVEVWRDSVAQSMATAYTNTIFYDGTVEASTTDAAAEVILKTAVVMQQPGPTPVSRFYRQFVKRSSIF